MGIQFSASLRPQPDITMTITIPSGPEADLAAMYATLLQVADCAIDAFKVGVSTRELVSPDGGEVADFGLQEARLLRSTGSHNWNQRGFGALLLCGEER